MDHSSASESLGALRLRGAARGPTAGARLGEPEECGDGRRLRLVLEIVVQVIYLPLDAIRILDPELVLVRVAAIHAHLLAHGQPGRLDPRELRRDFGRRLDLDPEVIDWSGTRPSAP